MNMPDIAEATFQLGDQVIDLSKVVAFEDAHEAAGAPAEDKSLRIQLADGSFRVAHGAEQCEGFTKAMESYLGFNLI